MLAGGRGTLLSGLSEAGRRGRGSNHNPIQGECQTMDPIMIDPVIIKTHVIPIAINVALAGAIFVVGRIIARILLRIAGKLFERSGMDPMLIRFISSILNAVLMLVIVVAALDQLGVDTTSLIALIGAAGLAIGLALQGSLQNFAAGALLIVFRPFKDGDYIEAAGTAGTVEQISIFTTTLKTPDNCEIIVPNGQIYSGSIKNFSACSTRRVDLVFGVGYGDDLRQAKQIIEDILATDERILAEPAPQVVIGELADSSVNIIVRPWVASADYWAVRFDLLERVKLTFDEQGVSIPFPQVDVHMSRDAA